MNVELRESGPSLPERVRLPRPMLAAVDGAGALLLDVGLEGALLEHYGRAQTGDRFSLTLLWRGTDICLECEVARTQVTRVARHGSAVSVSEMRFCGTTAALEGMLEDLVGRLIAAQIENANAAGCDGGAYLGRLGDASRLRMHGFIRYRYVDGQWGKWPTDAPMQPPDGFTVAAGEDEEEVRLLCAAYELADSDGRELIRRMARASMRRDLQGSRESHVMRMIAS